MNVQHSDRRHKRWLTPGLALLSLLVPLGTQVLVAQRSGLGGGPSAQADYRFTIGVLGIGMIGAVAALVGSRALRPNSLRWIAAGLAGLGLLIGAYLLWTLVGLCGLQVFWARCLP